MPGMRMTLRICSVLLAGGTLAGLAPAARPAAPAAHGDIVHTTFSAPSIHDPKRSVRVYLPPSYDRPEAAGRRYPTLYLLHGWPGGDGNWPGSGDAGTTLDTLIAKGAIPEVIAVMPNGSGVGLLGRSLYVNNFDGTSRMEDYIAHDLVAWVDSTYRTRPEAAQRGLIGLSEGASAAVNITFKHPDTFGGCGGHSGQYRLKGGVGLTRVLGPEPGASRILDENSPLLYAERIVPTLRKLTIYLDCGVDDEDIADNREFHRKLTELGVPHTYNEFRGAHGWGYWRNHLHESLLALTAHMR